MANMSCGSPPSFRIKAEFGKVNEVMSSDHNKLTNRELTDQHPIEAITGLMEKLEEIKDKSFVFNQKTASNVWEIKHDLHKMPSVVVKDSADNTVVGEIEYIDTDNLRLVFNGAFSGKAYLN